MMKEQWSTSHLFGGNAPFIEDLYEQWLANPAAVSAEWSHYFESLRKGDDFGRSDVAHAAIQQSFVELTKRPRYAQPSTNDVVSAAENKYVQVLKLISAYRVLGVRHAKLDPLKRMDLVNVPELDPATHGLTEADMSQVFHAGNLRGMDRAPLSEIIGFLKQTYCGSLGVEYMHITNTAQKHWVQDRLESSRAKPTFSVEKKKRILRKVTAAETLEKYLGTKFVGVKRFGLEGGETMIAALDALFQHAGEIGIQETVIGMAHRGRLNVLVNLLGKSPAELFSEFEGKHKESAGSGDVKYHMGFSSDIPTPGGPLHLTLAFNPSHLEIVNPVVEGSARARQHQRGDLTGDQILPLLIHGDAAFAGQGVNMETMALSQTRGYGTGGTVHVVVNNQIGFTTSDIRDSRSSLYCTDIGKMIDAPIFHVNGDDPEAVVYAVEMALDFRAKFHKDVIVDMVCFRKQGHNEADDPWLTQPMMYKKISKHPGVRKLYADQLVNEGVLTAEEAEGYIKAYREALDRGEHVEQTTLSNFKRKFAKDFTPYLNKHWSHPVDTNLPRADIQELGLKLIQVPENFKVHSNLEKGTLEPRRKMAMGELPLDFGMAESIAYASLLESGHAVRLSGQDCGRGTFSHRHCVIHDQNREKWDQGAWIPLQHLSENQAHFLVIDSLLSEEAVLGFEYGYSTTAPDEMVIWEAQFGDFANGAQVVIDQFITSGETKWGRLSGLTMLLPHGYDGQGPEHSSARVERFLQLCAEHNVQVVMPSTAAQMFHLLRRQMLRPYRKPLIVPMSKRLLKFKEAASDISEFTNGKFQTVINEVDAIDPAKVDRVIMCSGQVYYDLRTARRERGIENIAIVRLEQLYPFPTDDLKQVLANYTQANELMWVQEEPCNQGALNQIRHRLEGVCREGQKLSYAGRQASASPAAGYMSTHTAQLKSFVNDAMTFAK